MQNARVAAFLTFHYRLQAMPFLDRVLRNLSEFDVRRMHVTVVTNTEDAAERKLLHALCRSYFEADSFAIAVYPNCRPGTMLAWMHKPLLRAAAMDPTADFSHFLYTEDDVGLTYRNFRYFTEHADALAELGLIPSFLRTEFADGTVRSCDAQFPTVATRLVELYGRTFVSPRFPYCACFIMDRRHIAEYLVSRSFDSGQSQGLCGWGLPERAAMGLCWEGSPAGFEHRYVLPVDGDLHPLPYCQVQHMSANYAPVPASAFGKLPIEHTFVRPGAHNRALHNLRRLLTYHGTVVFVDVENGRLRHGPEASSPRNVLLTLHEGVGYLIYVGTDGGLSALQIIPRSVLARGRRSDLPPDAPQPWSLVPAEGSTVGLLSDDLYLCANPDGGVTLSSREVRIGERFSVLAG